MTPAQKEALASRLEDRVFDIAHLSDLLTTAQDFMDGNIVIPEGEDRARAVLVRNQAVAFVVACRLSLSAVRADLNAILRAGLDKLPEAKL